MGLILDSSVLIADERGKFDMAALLLGTAPEETFMAAISASELLHGVERADDQRLQAKRRAHVEQTLFKIPVISFDLAVARVHARIWADLASRGQMIGTHDLLIAATAIYGRHGVATLNVAEFQRVKDLTVIDASPYSRL